MPSEELLVGRRAIDEIPEIEILDDWSWNEDKEKWVLLLRISIPKVPNSLIPPKTDWYVFVSNRYPLGEIKFFPSAENSFSYTFQHQTFNENSEDSPWRKGDICLTTPNHALSRGEFDDEPLNSHERLSWYCYRAHAWLICASENELVAQDDPFEVPYFPNKVKELELGFSESGSSPFLEMRKSYGGFALFSPLKNNPKLLVISEFQSAKEDTIFRPSWGEIVSNEATEIGVWFLLPEVPILPPWQVPSTWRELGKASQRMGINLFKFFSRMESLLLDGKIHIAVLGFPIPETIGGKPKSIYWQGFRIPILSAEVFKKNGGRRSGVSISWRMYMLQLSPPKNKIPWIKSENWHKDQITSRGSLPEQVCKGPILIIGGGAFGSILSEMLVRAGATDIIIIDHDDLEMGNLTRHTLTTEEVSSSKAEKLAGHLNACSPNANVRAIKSEFPPSNEEDRNLIDSCITIIDCTAKREVIHDLSKYDWKQRERQFISLSVAMKARRLFAYFIQDITFSKEKFIDKINIWHMKEREEYTDEEFPRGSIGCWNPVFPARIDDVWLMASTSVKFIEEVIQCAYKGPKMTVFEQIIDGDTFVGLRRIVDEETEE